MQEEEEKLKNPWRTPAVSYSRTSSISTDCAQALIEVTYTHSVTDSETYQEHTQTPGGKSASLAEQATAGRNVPGASGHVIRNLHS